MRLPIVTITLTNVLPVAIVVAVQSIYYKSVCPYPGNLFIDVLTKVGYVKNATPHLSRCAYIKSSLRLSRTDSAICLWFVSINTRSTANNILDDHMVTSSMHTNLCNFDHFGGRVFMR